MTAVTYHGEYPDGQVDQDGKPYVDAFGERFYDGKSVDLKDENLLRKAAGNRFFKVAGKSDKDEVAKGEDEARQAEEETLRAWLADHQVPAHHKLGLEKLRGLKADYEKAQKAAQEA